MAPSSTAHLIDSGPLATPGIETIEMIEANVERLKQFGAVVGSLALASPIRLSGR